MSRIGKLPIDIPEGVKVTIDGSKVEVQGPKGTLTSEFHPRMIIEMKDNQVIVKRKTDGKEDRSLHGLTRSLIQNMITGVHSGFEKKLEIRGVGYRAKIEGSKINVSAGYSHPVILDFPEGIKCTVEDNIVSVSGISKEAVGQFAALIRNIRKPEPYKGKGIRYVDEHVLRKEGKRAAAQAG